MSDIKQGRFRIAIQSAHDLPGGSNLSCFVEVAHGEYGGSTHCLPKCGPNPVFNASLTFPYDEGEPVEFTVKDGVHNQKVVGSGIIHPDLVVTGGSWSGEVKLEPKGHLKVATEFTAAPKNPPPKAKVKITKGSNFTNPAIQAVAVALTLDSIDFRQTKAISRNVDGIFIWNTSFEFDYKCDELLTVRAIDEAGISFAVASFELWGFQNRGLSIATGQLPVVDDLNQTVGQIGIQVKLWDPADLVTPESLLESDTESRAIAAPFRGSGSSDPLELAARKAADDSEAAREAAGAAAIAASLRPAKEPRKSARISADAADDAERAATDASRLVNTINCEVEEEYSPRGVASEVQESASLAAEGRRRAEDAAQRTLVQAANDAVDAANEAAREAARAADAAAEVAEKSSSPEVQIEASKAAAAAQEAAKHAGKCLAHADKVEKASGLKSGLRQLRKADKEAKKSQRQQAIGNDAARQTRNLAKKQERLGMLNLATGRTAGHLDLQNYSDNGEYIETSVFYDNDIPPAACCYIPPTRAKLEDYRADHSFQTYVEYDTSPRSPGEYSSSRSGLALTPTAFGVPYSELDILIEGEMRHPTWCMCCGLKFKKYLTQ